MSRILMALLFGTLLVLTGCKDQYELKINMAEVINQHETVSYSADVESAQPQKLTYTWIIDDKVVSNLERGVTQFSTSGVHTVKVKAVSDKGVASEDSLVVRVLPADILNPEFVLSVKVADQQGFAVDNANVQIDAIVQTTNDSGDAVFDSINQTQVMVVSVSKKGFITQAYRYEFSEPQDNAEVIITLQKQAESIRFDASKDHVIKAELLNASVKLPANAFVDSSGNVVVGDVDLIMTPIDIRYSAAAFLGGGAALNADGEEVSLIPLGMIDFVFTQNNQPVQLAAGKQAEIRMDVVDNIGADGRIFSAGDSVPMWWFDTSTGLWIEDGVGFVVESTSSATGLELVAQVTHFTTWNWDYYFSGDRASFTLTCTREGQLLSNDENCRVTLSGSTISRDHSVGPSGLTVLNVNPGLELNALAVLVHSGYQIFRGDVKFTTISGHVDVNIDLNPVPTDFGRINCYVDNGSRLLSTSCSGTLYGSLSGTDYFSKDGLDASGFSFIKGEELTISAYIQDSYIQKVVDTSSLAGFLNVEFIVQLNSGLVSCYATLDGEQGEYFGCGGEVSSDLGSNTYFSAEEFTGNPKRGYFFYPEGSSYLTVWLSNVFTPGYFYEARQTASVSTFVDDSLFNLDLNVDKAEVNAVYNIDSDFLYNVECIYDSVKLDECSVEIIGEQEALYVGDVIEGRADAPTWMSGRVVLKGREITFAVARSSGTYNSGYWDYYESESYVVDHSEKKIIFNMIDAQIAM